MKVVIDASAAVAAVIGRDPARLLDILEQAATVLAPDLFAAELANSLWKYVAAGELAIEEAVTALESGLNLVDRTVPVASLAQEAMREAAIYGHPVYDLCYAVAARREGAAVLTLDKRLTKLLSQMRIAVVPRSE